MAHQEHDNVDHDHNNVDEHEHDGAMEDDVDAHGGGQDQHEHEMEVDACDQDQEMAEAMPHDVPRTSRDGKDVNPHGHDGASLQRHPVRRQARHDV
ncbi:unnamed protein product [Vitrella brassicaformis CCMP3155]|uniref:Uncharacterized protein n=1 Tax=Vitrella brassicaformis (strain CCMP3155) TaxID=1169540 RepID=A0A0G4GC79_VITBC|nr:unnamed protein product [Vitrella brassicaformis CCMP3155]|eukprot:CEM26576.1 unnamed protein product [Vitrella brassicaformis CCMP3155]